MLAQNFMPAEALGITEEQHDALVKTLRFFERGEVPAHGFDMSRWMDNCGTVACIGGWAETLSDGQARFNLRNLHFENRPLYRLFMGDGPDGFLSAAWNCTDPAQGAAALRNYLTTGDPQWESVMAEAL